MTVLKQAKRFNVLSMGRRWGKTVLGSDLAIDPVLDGLPVAWFAPSYKMMLEVWNEISQTIAPITKRISVQDRRIDVITGGVFEMWTLDDLNAGRGRKYARAIVDEAAMIKGLMMAWNASIRPTLTDLKGDAWFLSTPKGRNGFWQLYQMGLDPHEQDWACWRMPTVTNPYIDPNEVEAAKRMLPERIYQQEYEAAFIEDSGGVFRRIMEAATLEPLPQGDSYYIYGVDWGRYNDFTVIAVLDPKQRRMVAMDRFNQIDYSLQVARLRAMTKRFPPSAIVAEENSIGGPIIERLQRDEALPVQAFKTTNATKAAIIEGLAVAFEQGEIEILNDPVLTGELMAYDQERLPSGLIRYSAPEGQHDDTVMALALAWYGITSIPAPIPFVQGKARGW